MRLPVLLVCVVWCGLVASQGQEATAADYDYYGEPVDAPLDQAGAEGDLADYPIDEPAPTEAPQPVTTPAPGPKLRRKLVSLRKTPRVRSGGSRRVASLATPKPTEDPAAGSDAAPANNGRGTSGRGATSRRRPSRRGTGTKTTEPEVTEKPATSRVPSRRGRPSRTQTTSTSSGTSSRRGISRSSSSATDTVTEEPSSNSHRFAGRRTGSRRTSANTNTDANADPTEAPATQPSRTRLGLSRRKLRLQGKRVGVFQSVRTTPPTTTTTTTSTTTTTTTPPPTTTTTTITTPPPPPPATELPPTPAPTPIPTLPPTLPPSLPPTTLPPTTPAPTIQPTLPPTTPAPTTPAPARTPRPTRAPTTTTPAPTRRPRPPIQRVTPPSHQTTRLRQTPRPVRILTEAPLFVEEATTPAPPPTSTRTARRGSSRYSPPKAPTHAIVEPVIESDIFSPPAVVAKTRPEPATTQAPANTRTDTRTGTDTFGTTITDTIRTRTAPGQTSSQYDSSGKTKIRIDPIGNKEGTRISLPNERESTRGRATTQAPPLITTTTKYPRPYYGPANIRYSGGDVLISEVGTFEDTPFNEVQRILGGLGSRRRGLSRPEEKPINKKAEPIRQELPIAEPDLYEYYDDYYVYDN